MSCRHGATLVEAVLALAAGTLICGAMAAMLGAGERLARARADRAGRTELIRVAASVLVREFSAADPAADLLVGRDFVAGRLFRGLAVTCAPAQGGVVLVRWEGERLPDPAKDSVLPLLPPGSPPMALAASHRATAPCAGEGELLRWELQAVPPGTPLLLFQHGTYSLAGSALRLRHGAEGRQPLTGEWLDSDRSGFALVPAGAAVGAAMELALAFRGAPPARRLRVAFANAGAVGGEP